MEFVTREDLIKAANSVESPLPCEKLFSPHLNKTVWVQGLTALQKGKFEESLVKGHAGRRRVDSGRAANARALLAVRCLVKSDVDRTRLFADSEADLIANLPAVVLGPIFDLCQKLSGSSDEEMDELEKLSAEAGSTDSASS